MLAFDGGGGLGTWIVWIVGVLLVGAVALVLLAALLLAIGVSVVLLVRRAVSGQRT